jgi:hypothetical protein
MNYPYSQKHRYACSDATKKSLGATGGLVVTCAVLMTALLLLLGSAAYGATPSARSVLLHAGVQGSPETASPYGEVSRFGGFAEGGAPGKFDVPVGFAVDSNDPSTSDHNAVYVLDRVVLNRSEGRLGYRLQKLSRTGAVLGSATLPVQSFEDTERFSDAHPMFGLAVDSAKHRVYALVEGLIEGEVGSEEFIATAHSLVAWSTVPKAEGGEEKLVPAGGYPETEPLTGAALVAGPSVLEPEPAKDLTVPEGLAVNAKTHEVVIEAQRGTENSVLGGPTTLQSVIAEGASRGTLGPAWTANSTIAPNDERAAGVFTTAAGAYGVDLYRSQSVISRLAEVNSGLTEATRLAEDKSEEVNRDQAPTFDARNTPNRNGAFNKGTVHSYAAGSPVVQLSNGLYAARYGEAFADDVNDFQSEVEPWNGVPFFWTENNSANVANMGVRLFTSAGTVITTIGGQPQGQACNIDTEQLSVAAGANGSVFVLTQPNEASGNTDDEVIEFAPGGKGACPQPSGTLTVNGASHSSYSFPVNTEVTLTNIVERKGEAPYRFDWVLLNAKTLEVEDLVNQMEAPSYLWPAPSKKHTFTKKGTYYLAATVYGDYGVTIAKPEVVTITIH